MCVGVVVVIPYLCDQIESAVFKDAINAESESVT